MTRPEGGDVGGRGTDGGERSEASPGGTDDVTAALAREVYWAADGASQLSADARSLRERLDAFTYQIRADQQQAVPVGETLLGSAAGWKRGLKQLVWRLTRFSTMRYDRLLADLAEMNAQLARRLSEAEEELARLRDDVERRDGSRS